MSTHVGSGVIITNKNRTKFILQQKCDRYPIVAYRGCHSFFGGAVEPNEEPLDALHRELNEELPDFAEQLFSSSGFYGVFNVFSPFGGLYNFTLSEAIVSDNLIARLSDYESTEGIPKKVSRDELNKLQFIHGLERVIEFYCNRL